MRVLIVEDEPYLAEAIRDGLRLEAIAADIAGDGERRLAPDQSQRVTHVLCGRAKHLEESRREASG